MKFSARQDFNLPAEQVFDAATDFPRIEQILRRRGAEVRRLDPAQEPGAGLAWDIAFDLRGKRRELRLEVTQFDRPESAQMHGGGEAVEMFVGITVIALNPTRARIIVELEVKPRTMRARLMLQTAKLGKASLDRKFESRVQQVLGELTGTPA